MGYQMLQVIRSTPDPALTNRAIVAMASPIV
jgi:hypothetical protein